MLSDAEMLKPNDPDLILRAWEQVERANDFSDGLPVNKE